MSSIKSPALAGSTCIALTLLLAGCGEQRPALRFPMTEIASAAGLEMKLTSGSRPVTQLLEVKGGAASLLDVDADGLLDVLVPNGATLEQPGRGPGARLFRNTTPPGGEPTFIDWTEQAGLAHRSWSFGAAVGDVNGDGRDDVFLACFGQDVLLMGTEDGGLRDASEAAGIQGPDTWSSAASMGDLDGDGDLDLYVVGYVEFDPTTPPAPTEFRGARVFGGPMGLAAVPDRVYENLGNGTFREVTSAWGFDGVPPSYGLGAVVVDLDHDGRCEVLVGNDSQANFLFRRKAAGAVPPSFEDIGATSGLALDEHGWGQATMGIALADVTGDGLADIFSSNFMADHDTLHVNLGGLVFEDRSRPLGMALVTMPFLGWGAGFADLDRSGTEELLVLHGHVYSEEVTAPMGWRNRQEPQLFEQVDGRLRLVPVEEAGDWLAAAHCDRGAAFGDLDRDGDVDVIIAELGGPLRLLRNDSAGGHWLGVRLRDRREGSSNTTAIGARLTLEGSGSSMTRWLLSGTSYQSSSAMEAHFGLGPDASARTLEVHWPDGEVQTVQVDQVDRWLEVERR